MTEQKKDERRNDVFAQQATNPAAGIPIAKTIEDELGIVIPNETAPLPSNGIVYPPTHPFHRVTEVEIRGMTTRDEDILMSRALIKQGTVISALLKSCLVDRRVDPTSLISGDRSALLVAFRITGYGSKYPVKIECPACSEEGEHEFDLTHMPIKRLELSPIAEGENLFSFTFPRSKAEVRWRFLYGHDEEEIQQLDTKRKKLKLGMNGQESVVTDRLLRQVVSINGKSDRALIAQAIPRLPAADSLALRDYIDTHEPGIDMKDDFPCPHCGEITEVSVPIDASFFWPNAKR